TSGGKAICLTRRQRREQSLHRAEAWEAPEDPGATYQPLESRSLIEPGQGQHSGEPRPLREHPQQEAAKEATPEGPRREALDLSARLLDQTAARDPRGARCLTRPAPEAAVHVEEEVLREADSAFGDGAHEVDAPTRGVHLLTQHAVRWTLRQADAAVHAVEDALPVGCLLRVEGAQRPGEPVRRLRAARMRARGRGCHLDAAHVPAGIQHARGIKLLFEPPHGLDCRSDVTPDVEAWHGVRRSVLHDAGAVDGREPLAHASQDA